MSWDPTPPNYPDVWVVPEGSAPSASWVDVLQALGIGFLGLVGTLIVAAAIAAFWIAVAASPMVIACWPLTKMLARQAEVDRRGRTPLGGGTAS
jgi:hypothetical protein